MFEAFAVRRFEWDTSYDAEGYIALLSTFSSPSPWSLGNESDLSRR